MLKKFIYYSAILTFSIASLNAVHLGNLTEEDGYGKISISAYTNTGRGIGNICFITEEILFKKNTVIDTDEILNRETKNKIKYHLLFDGNFFCLTFDLFSESGYPGGKMLGGLFLKNLKEELFSSNHFDIVKGKSFFDLKHQ